MSEATERLLVRIDATTEVLRRELKRADDAVAGTSAKVNKSLDKIKQSFSGLGVILGAAGLGLAFSKIVKATAEQERVTAQLNATLASTGFAAGKTSEGLIATAGSLQKITRFGDEAIIGMQSLLLTFKDIKGDNFDRTTKAVLDMSTAMGQDLKSSAVQLGKALNDPIGQLGALSRTGIIFSDSQKEIIKNLAETGRMAEAQVMILQELESEFGGSAEAARNTLGGALEGLSMAFGDLFEAQGSALAPMKDSLNELESILADPRFVASVQQITAAIISMGAAAASAIPAVIDYAKAIGENLARAVGGIATDDIPALEGRIAMLTASLADMARSGQVAGPTVNALKQEIAELGEQLRIAKVFQEGMADATDKSVAPIKAAVKAVGDQVDATIKLVKGGTEHLKIIKEMDKAIEKLNDRHEKANQMLTDGIDELDEIVESTERYIEGLEFEVRLLGETAREQALLTAERQHGARATDEQREKINALNATLYDAAAATKAAEAAQKPFQDALQGTAERIDSAFAEAWRGSFDSFKDFASGIKDAFKNLLAELAHMAITRPIIMSFAGAFGLGGSSLASAGGISGLGSLASGASSLFSGGISGIPGNLLTGAEGFFANNGMQGMANIMYGAQTGLANTGSLVGGGIGAGSLITGGAGLLGGYLGGKVFGDTSGIGSSIGGIAGGIGGASLAALGAFGGPIGALAGAFLGSGLESLFGGNNDGDNTGRADLNFASGQFDVAGVGKSFDQKNVDAASQIAGILTQFSAMIGGSEANIRVEAGNRRGLSLDGKGYKDADALIADAFDAIVEGSATLEPGLKRLITGFEGTADETAAYAAALISLDSTLQASLASLEDQQKNGPIAQAINDFAISQQTLSDAYYKQVSIVDELTSNFDGTVESILSLNNAMAAGQQMAYQMAVAIQQIGLGIERSVSATIDYFNEKTRTPDEQLRYMQGQLESGTALLPTLSDPAKIQELSQQLLDISKKIFDAGPADLQRENVGTYLDYAQNIGELAAGALERAQEGLVSSQEDMNIKVQNMLQSSAAKFQESSDTMMSASQLMYAAVQQLTRTGFMTGRIMGEVV